MDTGLNVLLGKVGRPIVLNGKLLCWEKSPILASRPNYSCEYRVAGKDIMMPAADGDKLIEDSINEFAEKYGEILLGTGLNPKELLPPALDSFTGAIVMETVLFHEISRRELHEGGSQFKRTVVDLLNKFVLEYTKNWYEIYLYLFNRRLLAQHMPYIVKGHFVSGLYQPLLVETPKIMSPLRYGENSWLYSIFSGYEEFLYLSGERDRKISLSAVAMCDICKIFKSTVMFELDRKLWVLMVELLLMLRLDAEEASAMTKMYSRLMSRILTNPSIAARRGGRLLTDAEQENLSHYDYASLFANMADYAVKSGTQLATR